MTTAKWMLVGLLMGFLASSALSCGPAVKACGPKECPFGCCDAAGTCQVGSSDAQCGAQGAACSSCALAQRCNFGLCSNIGQSGGPGGGNGGGTGGGFTGGGTGGGVTGGGTGGGVTGGGTGGGVTGGGTGGGVTGGGTGGGVTGGGTGGGVTGGGGGVSCSPTNCTGCCAGNTCVPLTGNNNTACGFGGTACVNCAATPGGTCNTSTFTCLFPQTDAGGTCTGCLNGTACVPYSTSYQTISTCGGGGALCQSCAGLMCQAGNCSTPIVGTPVGNTRVRLVGGNGVNSGRLEVFANGGWGQVCDDIFDTNSFGPTVVCRDLGLGTANATQANDPGNGDFFLMDSVSCLGTETQLQQCSHDPYGVEDCSSSEAIFITCGP